jgi:hypothetical protein
MFLLRVIRERINLMPRQLRGKAGAGLKKEVGGGIGEEENK